MARLVYCDLVALTELQMDVLAGEYAADRPREDLGRQPRQGDDKGATTKNDQPKKG